MREAEAAQGQAGKVTTHSLQPQVHTGMLALANMPPYYPTALIPLLIQHVLGTVSMPDLWNKGKGAGAVLRMHPHLKGLPCQNHPYCVAQLSSLPAFPLSSLGDETYLDIFRDFSLMASDDPEKLSRRSHDLHTL